MGVFDNVSPGNAPGAASYGAGNMAAQLYQMIGGLPEQYFTGTQNARTLSLQKPILGPDGQPTTDPNIIMQELIRRGGGETAQKLLPSIIGMKASEDADRRVYGDGEGGGGPQEPNLSPSHGQDPKLLQGGGEQAQGQPKPGSGETVRTLATGLAGGRDVGNRIPNYARAIGVDPDATLTPQQEVRARQIIGGNVNPTGRTGENNETTPVGTGGPAGGAGIPAVTPPPQGSFASRFPAYPGGPPPSGGMSTPIASLGHAQMLEQRASKALRAAGTFGLPKDRSDALKEQASKWMDQAKQEREQLGKIVEATDPRVIGAKRQEQQNASDIKYYDTQYKGRVGLGDIALQQKPNFAVVRALAANPNLANVPGNDVYLAVHRLAAQFGYNPTGAAPQEVLRQLASRIVSDQFSGMKSMSDELGDQGGRIFKPMLDLEQKTTIGEHDSTEGILAKMDVLDHAGDNFIKWRNMAIQYKKDHDSLDPNFEKIIGNEMAKANLGKIGNAVAPPLAPRLDTLEQATAWARKQGLKTGDPMRLPSGRVVPAP